MQTLFEKHRRTFAHAMLALFAGLFIICAAPTEAHAYGRVIWKSTVLEERTKNESWYLAMEIHLPSPPSVSSKSMKFEFTQIAEFERSLEDGHDEPIERTVPLTNQQSIIESQLVGFMDPGSGQIQARTRFSFKVTRAHGYRAGKWKVKIKDGDTGAQIGTVTTLTLKGENPVIDRRSMVFQPGTKKKKEEQPASPDEPSEESSAGPSSESGGPAPEPTDEGQQPPSVEEKPGGGCHHGTGDHPSEWSWLALSFLLSSMLWMRRRA